MAHHHAPEERAAEASAARSSTLRMLSHQIEAMERGEVQGRRLVEPFRDPDSEKIVIRQARYCLTLLSRRKRSEHELREALLERTEQDAALVDEVIARLRRADLIDDAAFAEEWVAQRREHKLLGTAALRSELETKGVETAVINSVLNALEDADVGEAERCRELVQQRLHRELTSTQRRSRDRHAIARRLAAMLGRRGYSLNLSLRVVNEELDAAGIAWATRRSRR